MSESPKLTHLDARGRPRMVDVSAKRGTRRTAMAEGRVRMAPATLAAIQEGTVSKGNVLRVAEVAGVMAGKRTGELIPLCHLLPGASIQVEIVPRARPSRGSRPGGRPHRGSDRGGDGGAHRGGGGAAHRLRHGQGHRPRDGHRGCAATPQGRRPVGGLAGRRLTLSGPTTGDMHRPHPTAARQRAGPADRARRFSPS